jgi:hypothetical protein
MIVTADDLDTAISSVVSALRTATSRDWFAEAGGRILVAAAGVGADEVSASAVARVLADAAVPVVALNACQSSAMGKDLEAAIATRLLQEGTASVASPGP